MYPSLCPIDLCHKVSTHYMLQITEAHPHWPVCADVFEHLRPRLASRRPIWSDMTFVDTIMQWREDWSSASVLNHTVVTDPADICGYLHTWFCLCLQ